jgi:bifunctional UDP-N-acetylglucosamine pyrophosphorylase/glucosamine-1-phosphate N-acetyltransferase
MDKLAAVVMAAGKGKRMKSDVAKVLHEFYGRSMVAYVLDTLISLGINEIYVVIGFQAEEALVPYLEKIEFVMQEEQLGTGHAVQMTEAYFRDFDGDILVLSGDVPFLSAETITSLISVHRREKAAATVLSSIPHDPENYGRIVRLPGTDLVDYIVEDKDASEEEKKIGEINTGTFCFESRYLFESLREITDDNSQREYYLTDIMAILRRRGLKAAVCLTDNADEALGVNSEEQKAYLERKFAKKFGQGSDIGGVQNV